MPKSILTYSEFFTDLALNELNRHHSAVKILDTLAPNNFLLQTPVSFDCLTRPWRKKLPIYLHHLFPLHRKICLNNNVDSICKLQPVVHQLLNNDAAVVQVRIVSDSHRCNFPYTVSELSQNLCASIPNLKSIPDDRPPKGRVLSILISKQQKVWKAYLGVSWSTQNISPFSAGVRPYKTHLPNRAGYKLLEALDTFKIRLRPYDHALDLGAAPGAWTMVLRQHQMRVTAVAPREMYPELMNDPMIKHHHLCAEAYLAQVTDTYSLIVNDMKVDAQDSASLMVEYAKHLRSEGIAIMTLKVRQKNRRRVIDHSLRILRKAYKIIRIRQLVYNRNEVTVFLRRKS